MIRQMGKTLAEIDEGHVKRYDYAAYISLKMGIHGNFLDAGCGCGYGTALMAGVRNSNKVDGFDSSATAIQHARTYFHDPKARYYQIGFEAFPFERAYALLTMFEVLEHTPAALEFLDRAHAAGVQHLIASVPNEEVVPFSLPTTHKDHYRHFTIEQLEAELDSRGYRVVVRAGQAEKRGAGAFVTNGTLKKRTLVVVAERFGR